jgi:WD40 repeat protein
LPFDSFNSHNGEVVKILSSPDGRYVFSAGADGTLFIYSVTELANETTVMKQEITVTTIKEE